MTARVFLICDRCGVEQKTTVHVGMFPAADSDARAEASVLYRWAFAGVQDLCWSCLLHVTEGGAS